RRAPELSGGGGESPGLGVAQPSQGGREVDGPEAHTGDERLPGGIEIRRAARLGTTESLELHGRIHDESDDGEPEGETVEEADEAPAAQRAIPDQPLPPSHGSLCPCRRGRRPTRRHQDEVAGGREWMPRRRTPAAMSHGA